MKKLTRRKDKSEMYPMVELYQESDMTVGQFCREMNIAAHTFQYWLIKYRKEEARGAVNKFINMEIADEPTEASNERAAVNRIVRIHYPSGMFIEIPVG